MEQAAAKTLCSKILTAVELLQPGCSQSLAAFDGDKLLLNSAMTKVYAAASPNSIIIYDGRVGAALGLLVRHWLQGTGACVVPSDLAFRWGPNVKTRNNKIEKRDPTQGSFKFIQLYKVSAEAPNPTEVWAGLVRATNRILQSVIKTLAVQVPGVALLDLERALFMIGYDVRYSLLAVSK